jgi:ABC-type nitrate/sulfonate/bicarbonate transport system substrate-binding protein
MRLAIILGALCALVACQAAAPAPARDAAPGAAVQGSTAAPAVPAAPPLERVVVAYASATAGFAAPRMAKDAGLFQKYGLDAEIVYVPSGPTMIQSLIAGEIHFGELAAPSSMNAYVEGGDVIWITNARSTPLFFLVAQPDVERIEDLRGRPVGVTRIGTTTHTFMKLVLRSAGMDPERDVQIVQTGGVPETAGALVSGRISAALHTPPTHLAVVQEGMRVLMDLSKSGIVWPFAGSATRRSALAANPDRARKYLMAYSEAVYLLRTDRERGMAAMAKVTETSDPAAAEAAWDTFGPEFHFPPYPQREAMEVVIREELGPVNPRAYDVPPEDFYDDRLLRELEQSGFFRQIAVR